MHLEFLSSLILKMMEKEKKERHRLYVGTSYSYKSEYIEDESEMKLLCECILPWCYPNMYLVLKEKDVVHSTESYDKFMGLFLKKKIEI